jgi:histidine triad (HIT) family protein
MTKKFHSVEECLFCKIYQGKIPSQKVYEDSHVLGFKDLNPIAPIHILFIHRRHSENVVQLIEDNAQDLIDIFKAIKNYAEENLIVESGFRVINNLGINGGQSVFHTHFHLLGGEKLRWGN